MSVDCKELVEQYITWLRDKTTTVDVGGVCEITTPFLDRHNDRLQIYIQRTESGLRLTDDGYILGDLQSSGCTLDSPNRQSILQRTLNGFGVHLSEGELYVEASPATFPQKKHALIQAMMSVNDMFMMAKHRVSTLFLEDVSNYLEQNDIRFAPNVEFTGKTGFVHKFDFVIPKSRRSPERLVRAVNHPDRQQINLVIFSWTDTRDNRSKDSVFYVILNDEDKDVNAEYAAAFHEYDVRVIPWTKRAEHIEELAA